MNEENIGHRHESIARGELWPAWANIVVGVKDGWEAFEDKDDYEKFMAEYREIHKDDFKSYEEDQEDESFVRELRECGKIGFAA